MLLEVLHDNIVSGFFEALLGNSLRSFVPELVLLAGFVLCQIFNLAVKSPERKKLIGILAFADIGCFLVLVIPQLIPGAIGKYWQPGKSLFPYGVTLPAGYSLLILDNFAIILRLLLAIAVLFIIMISLATPQLIGSKEKQGEYYGLMPLALFSLSMMTMAADLITIYVSIELFSIIGFLLLGLRTHDTRNTEAAVKYCIYSLASSAIMIYGFSLFYGLTGTTNLVAIRHVLSGGAIGESPMLWFALILSLVGIGYKVGAAPFQFWIPDLFEGALLPVTGLLSVTGIAAGFGLLTRFLLFAFPISESGAPLINWPMLIGVISAITMVFGSLGALQQTNIKRLLGYGTISQVGFLLMGLLVSGTGEVAIGVRPTVSDPGIVALLIYLFSFVLVTLGALYTIVLIQNRLGSEEITDFKGLGSRMPLQSIALAIFLLSLTGLPLTGGFIGKFYLFSAVLDHTEWLWLLIIALVVSVISFYYYFRVITVMFIRRADEPAALEQSSGGALSLVSVPRTYTLLSNAVIFLFLIPVILLGIQFQPLVNLAQQAIRFIDGLGSM